MKFAPGERGAGVLLHPTSLPGNGISGRLGADARRFVDFLAQSGFRYWQMLPVGPIDSTGSPYLLHSAFAGGLHLLDADTIAEYGWWSGERQPVNDTQLVPLAYTQFRRHATPEQAREFTHFRARQSAWLLPWALFCALQRAFGGSPWWEWPAGARQREPDYLRRALSEHADEIMVTMFGQYLFDLQWHSLRDYAHARDVRLFGDLPFYVDHNSVDTWWQPQFFRLDHAGRPLAVAGVPPDYFSADGQLWGNPVYDWDALAADGFGWWLRRLKTQGHRFDMLRLDHFRAFESFWSVPAGADDARLGSWEPAPGDALLAAIGERLPALELVAEDLGTITPAVTELRERFGLPGMLVLQFAFDGSPDNPYLPANHVKNAVVYTGTHDNDTTRGWYDGLDEAARRYVDTCLQSDRPMPDPLIDAAFASPARLAVIPLQDLLGCGSPARMNRPGTTVSNWRWRFSWAQFDAALSARCRERLAGSGRLASAPGQSGVQGSDLPV